MNQEKMNSETPAEELKKNTESVNRNSGTETDSSKENHASEAKEETDSAKMSAEDTLKMQMAEMNDKYLRLYSDFDNFRKRANREKLDLIKTAASDVVSALLPVIDDMERALKAFKDARKEDDETGEARQNALYEGVELVYNKFVGVLKQQGVNECEVMGLMFDPDTAEAVAQIPAPDESQKGLVLDVIQKGYAIDGKVIRYAKVVVGC